MYSFGFDLSSINLDGDAVFGKDNQSSLKNLFSSPLDAGYGKEEEKEEVQEEERFSMLPFSFDPLSLCQAKMYVEEVTTVEEKDYRPELYSIRQPLPSFDAFENSSVLKVEGVLEDEYLHKMAAHVTSLQALARGIIYRNQFRQAMKDITLIQSLIRGRIARKRAEQLRKTTIILVYRIQTKTREEDQSQQMDSIDATIMEKETKNEAIKIKKSHKIRRAFQELISRREKLHQVAMDDDVILCNSEMQQSDMKYLEPKKKRRSLSQRFKRKFRIRPSRIVAAE
jgi:hypothetical protein